MSFWLMKFGSPSPKRLMLRSNWRDIKHMDLGRLPREEAARKTTLKTSCLNPGLHACIFRNNIIYNICMHMIRSERKKLEWNEGITGHTVAQRALYSCMMIYCSNLLLSARVYPPAFGQRLLRIWESSDLGDVPLRSLRNISVYI